MEVGYERNGLVDFDIGFHKRVVWSYFEDFWFKHFASPFGSTHIA